MALGRGKAQVTALTLFLLSTFYCSTPLVKEPVKDRFFHSGRLAWYRNDGGVLGRRVYSRSLTAGLIARGSPHLSQPLVLLLDQSRAGRVGWRESV